MGYILTTKQADAIVRALDFDLEVEDYEQLGTLHHYFLSNGTVLEIGEDGKIQHQELCEQNGDLVPVDMDDIHSVEVDYGVVDYSRNGIRLITMHF